MPSQNSACCQSACQRSHTYTNLGRTRARGLEVEVDLQPRPWLGFLGQYTFTDSEILESANGFDPVYAEGEPLLRRPRHQGALTARVSFPRWSAGLTVVSVGERADSDFVGIGLARNTGHTRVDARVRVRIVGPLEAWLVGENLTDATYQGGNEFSGVVELSRPMDHDSDVTDIEAVLAKNFDLQRSAVQLVSWSRLH